MKMENTKAVTIIRPSPGRPARAFTVLEDQYGVQVRDDLTGASVVLDWNGTDLKAVVNDAASDEPALIATIESKFGKLIDVESRAS